MRANVKEANKHLLKAMKPCYFDHIPVAEIQAVLKEHQIMLVNEDGTPFEAIFCGRSGHTLIDLAICGVCGAVVDNHKLFLSWYTMPSGRYEITTYLS